MPSRSFQSALAFALLLLAAAAGQRMLIPPPAGAANINAPASQSYLIIFGIGDKTDTNWDGSITATGSTITGLRGWRFTGTDSISGTSSWKLQARTSPPPPAGDKGPMQENGIIVTVAATADPVTFDVHTPHGDFRFTSRDVPFGASKTFLGGRALAAQTGAGPQLTDSPEEEDFPSMAQAGDDVYLAYTRFVHGDRTVAQRQTTRTVITDFRFLARPTGGDQVLLLHYSKSQRVWSGPFQVTGSGEDIMRTAVAVDGQGRAWVIYSANRNGNFDLYARSARADGSLTPEVALTTDPGPDLFPVAATDSQGRVWLAWQGFRGSNLEVLAAVETPDGFSSEAIVSTSSASDWDPSIAAAPNGEVSIGWDTYDKGDYDVYVRRVRYAGQFAADDPIPVAATPNFEARSSLAYDNQNRLWIAYEVAGTQWGKDFGAFDTTGIPLYGNHTIQVRCLVGADLFTTTDDPANVLPGAPAAELFEATGKGPFSMQPDPSIAVKRAKDAGVRSPASPKNSFPRIATDSEGTVYLAFRQPVGTGLSTSEATGNSVGSIWTSTMIYFDGNKWQGPGVLALSDDVGDNRPAILSLGPGRLLIGQAMDHRLSPLPNGTPQADGANSDLFALELPVARTQEAPKLQRIGQVLPDPPDGRTAAESAAVARNREYRATVSGQRYQLMRGDFHRHSEISFDGERDGPLIDSYRYFVDASALDWVGCCDHDNGGSREYSWWLTQKFTDAYLLGTSFVPMFYYERSVAYPEGHRNVVFSQRGVRPLPRLPTTAPNSPATPAPDTTMLYAYLRFFSGLSAPHTSATTQGTDWRNSDADVEPFVEIYQGDRQDYEMPGSPRANTPTDSISGYEVKGYVSTALDKGIRLGFEASSDHISTHISFTNLWVTAPTRDGIIDAMRKRRMYGSTDNILADFRSGPHFMGEAFSVTAPPVFRVRLWGTAAFDNIVIVKDGTIAFSTSGGQTVAFSWRDQAAEKGKTSYYYMRGLQSDGQIVWVSPMWVTLE